MVTQSQQGICKPKQIISLNAETISSLSKGYKQALLDPNWNPSMTDKYDALATNNIWSLVHKSTGTNIANPLWLYNISTMQMALWQGTNQDL